MWMAGGGIKGGISVGETDELGSAAVDDRFHVKNLHATVLHQLGLDPNRLTLLLQRPRPEARRRRGGRADPADHLSPWWKRNRGKPEEIHHGRQETSNQPRKTRNTRNGQAGGAGLPTPPMIPTTGLSDSSTGLASFAPLRIQDIRAQLSCIKRLLEWNSIGFVR